MTRRDCLLLTGQAAFARLLAAQTDSIPAQMRSRISNLIGGYERQGDHRTGTETDRFSCDVLMQLVSDAGLKPERESFSLNRVDPITARVTIAGRTAEGIPLFDGSFTDAKGIAGRLGPLGSNAPVGFTDLTPNAAGAGTLAEARHQNKHLAIIAVTRGGRPGLCPSNADNFLHPFGPPVVQISSEDAAMLTRNDLEAVVVAQVKRTPAEAFNVTAVIPGSNHTLPPLIVMTPRSGWWTCASERGGGIACWIELMRAMKDTKPARDVIFVASSGHEVGYLGIEAFVAHRPGIVKAARAWVHFGANIGAAQDPGNTIQASDDEMEKLETSAITKGGMAIDRKVPRGTVPGGEAGVVHRGGGRYMSLIGRNALFHNPADHGPDAVDVDAIARFALAFTSIAGGLASAT